MYPVCVRCKKALKNSNLIAGTLVGKAQKDNAAMRTPPSINFFAEIFVICDKNPVLIGRLLNDVIIAHSARLIVD